MRQNYEIQSWVIVCTREFDHLQMPMVLIDFSDDPIRKFYLSLIQYRDPISFSIGLMSHFDRHLEKRAR